MISDAALKENQTVVLGAAILATAIGTTIVGTTPLSLTYDPAPMQGFSLPRRDYTVLTSGVKYLVEEVGQQAILSHNTKAFFQNEVLWPSNVLSQPSLSPLVFEMNPIAWVKPVTGKRYRMKVGKRVEGAFTTSRTVVVEES